MDVLENSGGNVIITVGHESDLEMAKKTLSSAKTSIPLEPHIVSIDDESLLHCNSDDDSATMVKLLPIGSTNAAIYEDILKQAPSSSTVYVFESSWHALEESISLFGDNIPRGNGMAQTILGRNLMLSLNFPSWSPPATLHRNGNSGEDSQAAAGGLGEASQQNEALMNAWTNLVSEHEFSELLSARIVGSS